MLGMLCCKASVNCSIILIIVSVFYLELLKEEILNTQYSKSHSLVKRLETRIFVSQVNALISLSKDLPPSLSTLKGKKSAFLSSLGRGDDCLYS